MNGSKLQLFVLQVNSNNKVKYPIIFLREQVHTSRFSVWRHYHLSHEYMGIVIFQQYKRINLSFANRIRHFDKQKQHYITTVVVQMTASKMSGTLLTDVLITYM